MCINHVRTVLKYVWTPLIQVVLIVLKNFLNKPILALNYILLRHPVVGNFLLKIKYKISLLFFKTRNVRNFRDCDQILFAKFTNIRKNF